MCIEIYQSSAKNVLVGSVYRPPVSSKYLPKNFTEIFKDVLDNISKDGIECIILGDLNANYLKKNDSKELKDIILLNGFDQLISMPTRTTPDSSTLIDVVLSNKKANISKTDVIPFSLSDHDMIGCVRKKNHLKFESRTMTCRNYTNYDPGSLCNAISSIDLSPIYAMKDANKAWIFLRDHLIELFNSHAPMITKRVKGRHCPWLTTDVKKQMNQKDQLLRKARLSKLDNDFCIYKTAKNRCNNMVRKAKRDYHHSLINENKQNPRKFWKSIKEVFSGNKSSKLSIPYLKDNNFQLNENENDSKANFFCRYFTNIARSLKEQSFPLQNFIWKTPVQISERTYRRFNFKYVSKIFVEKELKLLKKHKSAGLDNLPPLLLRDSASVISKPISCIINLSLKSGKIPTEWKTAKVIPLHKSGKTTMPDNYRPISILPVLSKILEKAVQKQLLCYLEECNLLSPNQFGYRKKRSTEIATTLFIDNIRKEIDKGCMAGAVFIDLSKAFDTLGHSTLISKLKSYGIRNEALEWFENYFFERHQIVSFDNTLSVEYPVYCGVPQGSILGPILFLVFFNDFEDSLNFSHVVQFADDTVIYVADKSLSEIERKLNSDLENISSYFMSNELVINLKKGKTEAMLLGTSKRLANTSNGFNLLYNNTKIHETNTYNYLGYIIDQSLSLNQQFDVLYRKSAAKLKLLSKLTYYLPIDAIKCVYQATVQPTITYSCVVNLNLTHTQKQKLVSLDQRASKIVKNLEINTLDMIFKHAVKFVNKCLDGVVCSNFVNYFKVLSHQKNTRNNNHMLILPKVKLELAKRSFYFMGAKLYNSLPLEIRQSGKSFNASLRKFKFP